MMPSTATATPSTMPALKFVLNGYRRALVVMAGASFAGGLAEALFLITVTRAAFAITDGKSEVGIVAGQSLSVSMTLAAATTLVVVRVALNALAVWQSARVSTSVVAKVRKRLAEAFLSASWEMQQRQRGGSLQQLLVSYTGQARAMMTGFATSIVSTTNLVAMLSLAVAVDPAGAVVMIITVVVLGALLRPVRRIVKTRSRQATRAQMEVGVAANEASKLGMELHVFHVQAEAADRMEKHIDEARTHSRRVSFAAGSLSNVYAAFAYLALVAALAAIARANTANITSLGAVLLVMLRSLAYGQRLQGAYLSVIGAAPAIEDLIVELDTLEQGRRHDGGQPVGSVGVLEVKGVNFSYVDQERVLHDVSFSVGRGEVIGIVGPSGGGKSTLVQLLLGLRDPDSGSINADGRDIGQFSRAEWSRHVTFVPQEPHLIAGSIEDNIRFMRDGVSRAEVEHAARLAHLHEEIVAFPEGYERPVGEQGGHLSGGQRQRLTIARALVERPDVLILDEPTSALDVKSEHLIRSTLLDLKGNVTVFIIAHRLSTLDICDRIMVIQNGHLVGFDTPVRLEASSEFYREALQLSGLR